MKHSQNNIDAMTADELINGVTNGTIEILQAKDVLRIIESIESGADDVLDYDRGFEEGKLEGRDDGIQEAISALENL